MDDFIIPSPIGKLRIKLQANKLISLNLASSLSAIKLPNSRSGKIFYKELQHYFKHPQHRFLTQFFYEGSPFQKKVWAALRQIPCGETMTYGSLAKKLKTHARAIGQACRTNPIAIVIPCHRVVGLSDLGGYSGKCSGPVWEVKKWLLKHENVLLN